MRGRHRGFRGTWQRSFADITKSPGPSTSNAPPSPGPSTKKQKYSEEASASWILQFRKEKPTPADRMKISQVISAINSLNDKNSAVYRIRCLSAKWTEAGNLSIVFHQNTKDENVNKAKVAILQQVGHGLPEGELSLSKAVKWSKVIIPRVPKFQDEFSQNSMDVSEGNTSTIARPHQLHTPEQMKDEFYKTDAFKNIQMPHDPYSLGTNPPVLSQYMLSTWWFHVQNTNTFLNQNMLSSFRIC